MAIARAPQASFDELTLANKELAAALEDREEALQELVPIRKAYQGRDKTAKAIIEQLALEPGTYRCGRFKVGVREDEERHVEFEKGQLHPNHHQRGKGRLT